MKFGNVGSDLEMGAMTADGRSAGYLLVSHVDGSDVMIGQIQGNLRQIGFLEPPADPLDVP